MSGAALFNGNYVKLLKDQLKLFNTASILTGTDDPTVVSKDAPSGSIYLRQYLAQSGALAALNGTVTAMAADSLGNVYVIGTFTTAGGVSASKVAQWNGSTWSALGVGIPSGIANCIAVDSSNNVYVGGNFTTIGALTVNHIAKWNGSTWSAIGTGINTGFTGSVWAIAPDSTGNIYASFSDTVSGHVYKWNLSTWSDIGDTLSSQSVLSLVVDSSNNVYAGGNFSSLGASTQGTIAKWNGSVWANVGTGFFSGGTQTIYAMAVDSSNNLYVGGLFTSAPGVSANSVAKWNGSSWSAIGTGITGGLATVFALFVDSSSDLYVGGSFTTAGSNSVNNLAVWNTTSWVSVGTGANNTVDSIVYSSVAKTLYFGGSFTSFNGSVATYTGYYRTNSTPSSVFYKLDDGITSNWKRIDSTDALSVQRVITGVAYLVGGSVILPDGRVLSTWDSTSSNPSNFDAPLSITLSSLLAPTTGLKAYLYIDLTTVAVSPTNIVGTPSYVYPVAASNFVLSTVTPELIDGFRYLYIADFIADSAPSWTSSNWYNAPKRVATLPLKYMSPITFSVPPTVVGSVGSANQMSQAHVLDINSFPSTLPTTSWWSLSSNLLDGNVAAARNLTGTVASYSTPGLFGTDNAANITSALSVSASFASGSAVPFVSAGWFKLTNWIPGVKKSLMTGGNLTTDLSWDLHINIDGSISAQSTSSSNITFDTTVNIANPNFAASSWHHCAFVFTGSSIVVYFDGRFVGSANTSGIRIPTSPIFTINYGAISFAVREVMSAGFTVYSAEDVRKLASYKIAHNKNTPSINQRWNAGRVRADGDITEDLGDQSWMVDKTNLNNLYVDFSDIGAVDAVYLKLSDETPLATSILMTKTFDTGWMTSQPTGALSHHLPDVPASVILQYESVTGSYTTLAPNDYLSWNSTQLLPYLSAFGLLTISSAHKWRIVASLGANAIGLQTASLSQAGIVSVTDQHFNGNKFFNGNVTPETDLGFSLGSASQRWSSVHVGPGSLVVHNDATNTKTLKLGFDSTMAQLLTDSTTPMEFTIGSTQVGLIGTGGAWTIGPSAGGVTHSMYGSLAISATSNQLVLGAVRTLTIAAPTPATSSRTMTIPDIGADASFVLTAGAQSIGGVKTFTGGIVAGTQTTGDVYSASYTPTIAIFSGLTSGGISFKNAYFFRVGNRVNVYVRFDLSGTNVAGTLSITLPVPSTLSGSFDLFGTALQFDGSGGSQVSNLIYGDNSTVNKAYVILPTPASAGRTHVCNFVYVIN